jgi:hypothetical protein
MVNHSPLQADEDHSGGEAYIKKRKHGNMLKENQPAQSNICLDKYNTGKSTHSHFLLPGSNQTKPSGIDMQHEIPLTRS